MSRDPVPFRHSLVTRLLVTSVLIAIVSISATAWLATTTATRAISQEQGTTVADDKAVYEMLTTYAATHRDWSGAAELLRARAAQLQRRITLTGADRTVILDSAAAGPSLRTARPSAVVDPLDLDLGLTGGVEHVDPRVVGPYLVPPGQRRALNDAAATVVDCLRKIGADRGTDYRPTITARPSGRPAVVLTTSTGEQISDLGLGDSCLPGLEMLVSTTEQQALQVLTELTARCLGLGQEARQLRISPGFQAYLSDQPIAGTPDRPLVTVPERRPVGDQQAARSCVDRGRRTQLQPYVAPRALLFVTAPGRDAGRAAFSLSPGNIVRIAVVTGAVLLATIAVTVLVGRRLVRPLRNLADAADRHTLAPASTRDEIGRLARALNDSTERRDRAEAHRRTMVTDVAHELRTPLSNIRTWLEAAQDDLAPTDAQLLALLHDEALQLQHIIDDLGDLSAADAGTLRIRPQPTALREALAQVADSHRGTAQAAGVQLELAVEGDPVVSADPVRLRQLVGNLVANAIRYTPAGGTVTVGAAGRTITVRDTGSGIAAADLPRIFDRFWRAEKSRSRATGGSGLGLAIARQLSTAHGGTLEVESRLGHGTLFTIRLP